jgi:hypothetical protein
MISWNGYVLNVCGNVLLEDQDDRRGLNPANDNRQYMTRSAISKAKRLHLRVVGALLRFSGLGYLTAFPRAR